MALRLTLKPSERVIISGAVLRNGDQSTRLTVENRVPVLRESDILSPRAVRTPCERVYLALQLSYVDPERARHHLETYRALAAEVLAAAPSTRRFIDAVDEHLLAGRHYQALKSARPLIDYERELLSHVQ